MHDTQAKGRTQRGVTLLELMVAMVAASAILGGAGVIYMTALSSFVSAEATGKMSGSRTAVDEVMTRIAHQCFPVDIKCKENPAGKLSIVTYVRAANLLPALHLGRTGDSLYPLMSDTNPPASMPGPNPDRRTGIVYWFWGGDNGSNDPDPVKRAQESSVLHLELSEGQYIALGGLVNQAYATNRTFFTGMTTAEIDAFIGLGVSSDTAVKRARRLATTVLAVNVANFNAPPGLGGTGLTWSIDFLNRPL